MAQCVFETAKGVDVIYQDKNISMMSEQTARAHELHLWCIDLGL